MQVLTSTVGAMPKQPQLLFRNTADTIIDPCLGTLNIDDSRAKEKMSHQAKKCITFQEEVGLDIIVDGALFQDAMSKCQWGSTYIHYFLKFNHGVKTSGAGSGHPTIVGHLRSVNYQPIVSDYLLASQSTDLPIKINLPGLATVLLRIQNQFYPPKEIEELITDYALALKSQIDALYNAGCHYFNIDEPNILAHNDYLWAIPILDSVIADYSNSATFILHICRGNTYNILPHARNKKKINYYERILNLINKSHIHYISVEGIPKNLECFKGFTKGLMLGVIDQNVSTLENTEEIVLKVSSLIKELKNNPIILTPYCGLKHLSFELAKKKLAILIDAAYQLNR